MHHVELAWALARAARQCVDPEERFDIYVALGAGDTDTAIARVIPALAREQLGLPAEVVASLAAWRSAQPPETDQALGPLIAILKIAPEEPAPAPERLIAIRRHRPLGRRNRPGG